MYSIYIDGVPIYLPGADERILVTNPLLELELNTSGTLTFDMPSVNAEYDSIKKLKSTITVKRNDDVIWVGRVTDTKRDLWNNKSVTCEGALGFLNDVVIRPFEYRGSLAGYVASMLDKYNASVLDDRKIYTGNITVVDNNDYVYKHRETHTVLLDLFKEQLLDSLGGFLKVRYSDGKLYLDYLAESGKAANQVIAFGENLLDITETISTDDVYTVIIPLGATITEEYPDNATEDYEPESYTVDITSVNNGKDYIESEAGIELYGRIERVVEWPDVETASRLKSKAEDELERAINSNVSISITAVDMHWTDDEIEQLELGDYCACLSIPNNIYGRFSMSAMSIKLDDPSAGSYTLGATPGTLTGIVSAKINATESNIDSLITYKKNNKDSIDTGTEDNNLVGSAVVGFAVVG